MSTTYYPHEIRRHTRAIKEVVQRACHIVFGDSNIAFRLKNGPGTLWKPSEHLQVSVVQKTGWCQSKPICSIEIDRPQSDGGMYAYKKASAALLDQTQHVGNTRLLGHLQHNCPFLPRLEVTLAYELEKRP
jgi:hypothetical protein